LFIDNFIVNFKKELVFNYSNTLAIFILLCFLIFNTYTDLKEYKIYNKSNLLLIILRLVLYPIFPLSLSNLLGGVFSFIVFIIPAVMFMYRMGGDIKLATVIGFYLGLYTMPLFIAITLISAMALGYLIRFIKNKNFNKLPLAPFFLVSHIVMWILFLIIK